MDSTELFQKAQQLFLEGKHEDSIKAFTEAIEAGEKIEISFLSRGVAYIKINQFDNAIKDFGKVIEMNNQNYRAYFYRGTAYMSKEKFENAIADFDRTIELKPDHGAAFFARGTAYAQIGNEYEASRNLKTAIAYSESSFQGIADHYGIFRTQVDKALALMTGEGKPPTMELTDEEKNKLKRWLEEENKYH